MNEKQGTASMHNLDQQELDQVSGGSGRTFFYCPSCGDDFPSESERTAHLEAVHGIVTCPICKRPMNKGAACEVCGYSSNA